VADILHSLESSVVGIMVRESLYGFQILVAIHLVGLVLSVGTLLWFDLRLLGLALQSIPVSRVYRLVIPWAACGFGVMVTSGALLFVGYAPAAYANTFFRIKLIAMLLAAANAARFHLVTERGRELWDGDRRPPRAAGTAGLLSLLLWAIVIVCGRAIAYTMY
jgi:hypothetical protein